MNTPQYFERWSRAKNEPIGPLSAQVAKARHAGGTSYVAVVIVDEQKCVVDIAGDWVSVLFFDPLGRLYVKYDFKRMEPGRVFLSSAMHMEFEGGNVRPQTAVTFAFEVDGAITIEKRDMLSGELYEKNSHGDPAVNWDAYPEFGDYRSLCRLNRE